MPLPEKLIKAKQSLMKGSNEVRDNFRLRPSDIIIATPMKSGTAWMQQICHQLRTGGDEDFDDIDCIVPRIPAGAFKTAGDLNAEQKANPRCYNAHDSYDTVHKPCRYIVCLRDPVDAAYSAYNFINDVWGVPRSDWDPAAFWYEFQKGDIRSIFQTLPSWWPHRHDSNVLWLHFEDLKKDHRACVHKVAEFMNIKLSKELEELVVHRSTFEYMKRNKTKFDTHSLAAVRLPDAGVSLADSAVGRTREGGGQIGQGKERFPPDVVKDIEKTWKTDIATVTGYNSYKEMWERESFLFKKTLKYARITI